MNELWIAGCPVESVPWLVLAADNLPSVSLFQHFVIAGGWITWFLLIPLSVATVALVAHYAFVVRRAALAPPALVRSLKAARGKGGVGEMCRVVSDNPTMLGQAACAGFSQLTSGRDTARAAIEETVDELAMRLLRRIEYLNVIGSISPMIGLFGTVVGMIQAFSRIFAAAGGMPEADKLAGDIAVALVTTFWGLLIAIPALTAFALFRNRVDAYAAEVIKLCDGLLTGEALNVESEPRPPSARG
ncbi:MAG TPA: MotA/TolQ/ExbB proton channel family protein [Phycisphaerae bacterium]|nr:MotA/TolQ/ExbB proton channel family protein [Phycisphaerae bacterium]